MKKGLTAQEIQDKAFAALKKAVLNVVKQHKKTDRSLAIWQNGKVVCISSGAVCR